MTPALYVVFAVLYVAFVAAWMAYEVHVAEEYPDGAE